MNKKFLQIPYSLLTHKELNLSAKMVLAQIISFDVNGDCFISNAALSDILGISERAVAEAVRELKSKGYITSRMTGRVRRIHPSYSKLVECGIRISYNADFAPEEGKNRTRETQNPHSCNAESAQYNNNYNKNYKNNYNRATREKGYCGDTGASYDIEELEKIR